MAEDKNQKPKIVFKKEGSEDPKGNGQPENRGPRFNFYWIYAIIGVFFLAMLLFPMQSAEELSKGELLEMVRQGEVEKIIVVNRKRADI